MDLARPHRSRLILVFSALLVSAFFAAASQQIVRAESFGMRAETIHTVFSNGQVYVPRLNDAQLSKIVAAIDKSKSVKMLPPEMAVLLSLPKDQKNTFKFHFFMTPDGINHIFARLNERKAYLICKGAEEDMTFVHLDGDFQFVAAAKETYSPSHNNRLEVLPLDEAAKLLEHELAAWAKYADTPPSDRQRDK